MTNAELEQLVREQAETINTLSKRVAALEAAPPIDFETPLDALAGRVEVLEARPGTVGDAIRDVWINRVLAKYHANDKPAE